jgi:hypothetical protein
MYDVTMNAWTRAATSLLIGLALTACPSPEPSSPPVQTVFDHLPAGLLSVWGTSADDVWTVGSDPGDGPFVLHFDGTSWTRLATGASSGLWWVHGWEGGPVLLGGDDGLLLSYEDGAFTRMTTPSSARTVFGIWGASPNDVLAVGGVAGSAGFVWHYDGTTWNDVALPEGDSGLALFKVWGVTSSDAWVVGAEGRVMHWDGSALTPTESPASSTLFTVHAIPGLAVAVGGAGNGVIIERSGTGDWHDVTPPLTPTLIGVWITENDGWAVGSDGQWLRRVEGNWTFDDSGPNLAGRALHSVWVDPADGVWSAGGQVLVEPIEDGTLQHRGPTVPGDTYESE